MSQITVTFKRSHIKNMAIFFLPDQYEKKRFCLRTTRGRRAKQLLEKYARKGQLHEVPTSSKAFRTV
jgi:hypothetical protein